MARGDYENMFRGSASELADRRAAMSRTALGFHMLALGKQKNVGVDFITGSTELSVSNYFQTAPKFTESRFKNPVNEVALEVLPGYAVPGEQSRAQRIWDIRDAGKLTIAEATRANMAAEWLVSSQLELWIPTLEGTYTMRSIAEDATSELNAGMIKELPEMVDMVMERGYQDLLGYLVDAKTELTAKIDAVFEAGPQSSVA